MKTYYFTTVTQQHHCAEDQDAIPIAEVAFQSDEPHAIFSFVLEALDSFKLTKHKGSGFSYSQSEISLLADLPPEKLASKPDWSNNHIKIWIIKSDF